MEIESAARRFLMADATVNGYVVGKVYRWRLEDQLDGTGGRAIVVQRNGGWRSPDAMWSVEFPMLWVDCYADRTRNAWGDYAALDAEDKAFALAHVVDRIMHGRRDEWWGAVGSNLGLHVVSCWRNAEPRLVTAGDRHAAEPTLGDTVFVRTAWNVTVQHYVAA